MKKTKLGKIRNRTAIVLSAVLLLQGVNVTATEDTQSGGTEEQSSTEEKIDDANEKLNELQDAKEEVDSKVNELSQKKTELSGELADLNTKLEDLSSQIEDTQAKLNNKKAEVEETTKELGEAEDTADQQYEDMKDRIRYIYENGTQSYLETILESDSFSDMLNRVEYVTAINEYDRQMLEEYENTIQKIADKKVTLEGQQTELEEISGQLENEKGQVQEVVAETQQVLEENNAALDDAQSTADQYDQQIEDQMAYEAELEAQKAREDAERMAEIKRQEEEAARAKAEQEAREREEAEKNQNSDGGDDSDKPQTPVSASDQTLLAALIHCEAAGESYEGKLAVGSVVMNRVASSYYPNSIAGVIYQSGQFSPVASGRFATVLASGGASADSSRAASEVLAGNITNSFLYFRTIIPGIEGTIIGNHIFY